MLLFVDGNSNFLIVILHCPGKATTNSKII